MPTFAPRHTEEIEDTLERAAASARERLRRKKARQTRTIVLAVLGALLLHALLIPPLTWMVSHWPRKPLPAGNAPFHLSLTRSEDEKPPAAAAPTQPATPYMRTTDSQVTEEEIKNPDFQSDKTTKAAAELPADASKPPLPTQQGSDIPTYDFETTPYRPGKEASSAASAASAARPDIAPPTPNETPQPERKSKARESKTKTSPRATAPKPTPVPDGELATLEAQPTPVNEPPHPEETPSDMPPPPAARASSNPPSRSAPNSVTSPGLPKPPGYQQQTIQSKLSGSINNRGKSAVQALSTPLGRYQKGIEDAIGSMWYIEVEQQMSFLVHTSEVRLHFYITRSGRVRSVRVSGGDPNNALASLSIGAVSEAEIAPIPPDVAAMLPGGELEVDMGFEFFIH